MVFSKYILKQIYQISYEYVFSYRSMKNPSQNLMLKFVNSIWEDHMNAEGVLKWRKRMNIKNDLTKSEIIEKQQCQNE